MGFRGQLWLHHSHLWIQSVLFGLWLLALTLSVAALWRPRTPRFHRFVRGLWLLAMVAFLAMWVGGATLELMRRTALISWKGLVVVLAAFSLFMAGALSLARECLDAQRRLIPGRIVLTLLALTFAGGFFGGFALPFNALFETGVAISGPPMPLGWVLALGGAQLLTVAHTLKPNPESNLAVRSPREATLWLSGWLVILLAWNFDQHHVVALVAYVAFATFLTRVWIARLAPTRRGAITLRLAPVLLLLLLLFVFRDPARFWVSHASPAAAWRQWPHAVAWTGLCALTLVLWRSRVRDSLRLATQNSMVVLALWEGLVAGGAAATLLFGPTSALWWSFWPLAGCFFDLLQVDDEYERKWQRLATLKGYLRSQRGRALEPPGRDGHDRDGHDRNGAADTSRGHSPRDDGAADEPVELSAGGRPFENG